MMCCSSGRNNRILYFRHLFLKQKTDQFEPNKSKVNDSNHCRRVGIFKVNERACVWLDFDRGEENFPPTKNYHGVGRLPGSPTASSTTEFVVTPSRSTHRWRVEAQKVVPFPLSCHGGARRRGSAASATAGDSPPFTLLHGEPVPPRRRQPWPVEPLGGPRPGVSVLLAAPRRRHRASGVGAAAAILARGEKGVRRRSKWSGFEPGTKPTGKSYGNAAAAHHVPFGDQPIELVPISSFTLLPCAGEHSKLFVATIVVAGEWLFGLML